MTAKHARQPSRPPGRRGRLVGNAAAVTASQAITAGGSLILQILAARNLGRAGYGGFALCLALLSTAGALYTGYIGDSLTVLDRRDPATRHALALSAILGLGLCFGLSFAMVIALRLGDWRVALLYALLVLLWLVEETGRRVLMARLEFWALVLNDAAYMFGALAALGVAVLVGARFTLGLLLGSMAFGALIAMVLARLQLPAAEYRELRPRHDGVREVARFAMWRSLQATLRPTQLLLARVLVLQVVGLAAVGAVEAGRLVVAPIQTVLSGAASFLLSTGADDARRARSDHRRNQRAAILLLSLTLTGGALAAAVAAPLGRAMTGQPVPRLLVLGWAVYLAMWAASLPFTAELTVRKLSWPVFITRLLEVGSGLALVLIALLFGGHSQLVPWLLSGPGLVNTWYLRRLAIRTRAVEVQVGTGNGGYSTPIIAVR